MKRALIVFPDGWLPYSPTVLNFETCLQMKNYCVDVVAIDDGMCSEQLQHLDGIYLEKVSILCYKLLPKLRLYSTYKLFKLIKKAKLLKKTKKYDMVVGVDELGFLAARLFHKEVIYLSLEVRKSIYFRFARLLGFSELIIQSEERGNFLIGSDESVRVYYIQNSPILEPNTIANKSKKETRDLIYLGNIIPNHGVENCIQSVYDLDHRYRLTLKGLITTQYKHYLTTKYKDLFESGRLKLDQDYIEQSHIRNFLCSYYIGFCMYDIYNNDFNYITCPSGKLFNYYAAGVPVIGSDIPGLISVKDYNAGILIKEPCPESIVEAIFRIEHNYEEYSYNSLCASRDFDFKTLFNAFIKNREN